MRLYEDRNKKRHFQCTYCLGEGHNKRNCPTMKAQWLANPQVHETYDHNSLTAIDKTMFPVNYQHYWGDDDARRQFRGHWRYMKSRFAPKAETKPKKRRKAKCGFCGSTAHNRRNCNKLKNFVYVLKETNKAYRSAYYDKFVEGMGLGAGALVSAQGYDGESMGILTSFPTEQIMFTNLLRTWSDYHTKANAKINLQGSNIVVNLGSDCFRADIYHGDVEQYGIWLSMYSNWGRIINVVSPAPNRPTKEWFMGQTPCFEWVVKKRDQATLMSALHRLIKHFYPHDNLRAKLGAKIYDQYYTR
jgi:hypothetical protein